MADPEVLNRKKAAYGKMEFPEEFKKKEETAAPPPELILSEQQKHLVDNIDMSRLGPQVLKYAFYAGGALIGMTYLRGFVALAKKNRDAWQETWRQRVLIMSPLLSMYCTGYGVIPVPFKRQVEEWVGRTAYSGGDYHMVEEIKKKQAEATKMPEW